MILRIETRMTTSFLTVTLYGGTIGHIMAYNIIIHIITVRRVYYNRLSRRIYYNRFECALYYCV